MGKSFETFDKSVIDSVINTHCETSLTIPCLLQTIADQCPSFAIQVMLCGSCSHAINDHRQVQELMQHPPVHEYQSKITIVSLFSNNGGSVLLRHDGTGRDSGVVSMEAKKANK